MHDPNPIVLPANCNGTGCNRFGNPCDWEASFQMMKWLPVRRCKASSTGSESDTRDAVSAAATCRCCRRVFSADRCTASQAEKPTLANTAASSSPTMGNTNCRVSDE